MTDFAAIDFEIANREPSSVCSVGVVIVRDGQIVEKIYRLIRPEPEWYYPDYEFHCTCRASRSVFGKSLPNHKLPTVAAHCGYDLTKHHHALADAEACAVIALKIL